MRRWERGVSLAPIFHSDLTVYMRTPVHGPTILHRSIIQLFAVFESPLCCIKYFGQGIIHYHYISSQTEFLSMNLLSYFYILQLEK